MKKFVTFMFVLTPLVAYGAFETTVGNPTQIYRGTNSTSTTATIYTLTASDIIGYSSILMMPNTASLTMTLPASTTLATWLPTAGDNLVINLLNSTSTSGINIGLVAGSGTLLASASSTATTTYGKMTEIRVIRKLNRDFLFTIYPTI